MLATLSVHKKIGFTQRGYLSTTAGWSGTTTFSSASATSTVNRAHNMNTGNYVDWSLLQFLDLTVLVHMKAGSADGPMWNYLSAALIIIKNIDNVGTGYEWFMFDSKRYLQRCRAHTQGKRVSSRNYF